MKEKYLFFILTSVLIVILSTSLTIAEENFLNDISDNPGTTPDRAGYWLKLRFENLKTWLEFNQEKKLEKEMGLVKLRLLEAKLMAEKGDLKAMERANSEYEKLVEKIKKRINKIKEEENYFKGLIGIERAIEIHKNRIEILKDFLEEKNLTDEQRNKINEIISRLENKTEDLSEKIEQKEERIKERLESRGKTKEEIEKKIEEIENEQNLTKALKIVAENRIQVAEKAIEKLKERINEEKTNKVNISFFELQITEATENLEEAKALYNEGKYKEAIRILKPLGNYGRNMKAIIQKAKEFRETNRIQEIERLKKEVEEQNKSLKRIRIENKPKENLPLNVSNKNSNLRRF